MVNFKSFYIQEKLLDTLQPGEDLEGLEIQRHRFETLEQDMGNQANKVIMNCWYFAKYFVAKYSSYEFIFDAHLSRILIKFSARGLRYMYTYLE